DIGKGTGLGLAQIYGFVRQSGGTATIDSAVGRGTTVSLYLPRAAIAAEDEQPGSITSRPVEGHGKTILVVDDQADVREVVETWLSGHGYRIVTAADGIEARRLLQDGAQIDLLLTDVVMPNGVSGIELARTARRLRPTMKIVLVSGFARDMQTRIRDQDDFVFLEKPFRQMELAETIDTLLGSQPKHHRPTR
ncbi:MAG TPA: response regulator, partial [Acetobacteraceae bacterium]|nr:response regulator [Acetobacteraceae bacterium]